MTTIILLIFLKVKLCMVVLMELEKHPHSYIPSASKHLHSYIPSASKYSFICSKLKNPHPLINWKRNFTTQSYIWKLKIELFSICIHLYTGSDRLYSYHRQQVKLYLASIVSILQLLIIYDYDMLTLSQ